MKGKILITAIVLVVTLVTSLTFHLAGDSWSMERMLESLEADLASGERFDEGALRTLTREERHRAVADAASVRSRVEAGTVPRAALDPLVDIIEDAYGDGVLSEQELADLRAALAALGRG